MDERRDAARLRQRLWGAMVLVAIAVIGLPLLLDGSGSESRFRHVEQLREEPPRIVSSGGEATLGEPSARSGSSGTEGTSVTVPATAPDDRAVARPSPTDRESPVPDGEEAFEADGVDTVTAADRPSRGRREGGSSDDVEPLSAWVVQAGSFGEQRNAIEVRERLRAAGFPSFVTDTSAARSAVAEPDAPPMFRVQVGPMVDRQRAAAVRERVEALLGGEPIIVTYP